MTRYFKDSAQWNLRAKGFEISWWDGSDWRPIILNAQGRWWDQRGFQWIIGRPRRGYKDCRIWHCAPNTNEWSEVPYSDWQKFRAENTDEIHLIALVTSAVLVLGLGAYVSALAVLYALTGAIHWKLSAAASFIGLIVLTRFIPDGGSFGGTSELDKPRGNSTGEVVGNATSAWDEHKVRRMEELRQADAKREASNRYWNSLGH